VNRLFHRRHLIIFALTAIATFFAELSAEAAPVVSPWAQHCQAWKSNPKYIQQRLLHPQNRLTFTNEGGLFNGGVCWWHSRFTRNAQYLAVYLPQKPKPNKDQANRIISQIRAGKPVEIPGYSSLAGFSLDHQKLIQSQLETWQISNGGFGFAFIDGLSGSPTADPKRLQAIMADLYVRVATQHESLFQILQLPGVMAHAWIVTEAVATPGNLQFTVIDSNFREPRVWNHTPNLTHFTYYGSPFVPYTVSRGISEEKLLRERLAKQCSGARTADQWLTLDEELDLIAPMQAPTWPY